MDIGSVSLCLKTKDLAAARRFYEAIGLSVRDERAGKWIVMGAGTFRIALMAVIEETTINFRGADIYALYEEARRSGYPLDGKPESYEARKYGADADGDCWITHDPDGNTILFDTNETEIGPSYLAARVSRLLRDTHAELESMGASAECLEAFRHEIIAKFA